MNLMRHRTATKEEIPLTHASILNSMRIFTQYLILTLVLSMPLIAAVGPISSAVSYELTQASSTKFHLSVATPTITSEQVATPVGTFDKFELAGELTLGRPGWPDLPVISRTILMPPTGAAKLNVTKITSRDENGFQPIVAPPAEVEDVMAGVPSEDYLITDSWFPPEPIVIDEPAIMRGNRIVTVYTFPIQYNPATGQTRFNEEIKFDLEFEGNGSNEVANPSRIPASNAVQRALENMVINPPQVPVRDDILTGNYLYIAQGLQSVDDALRPLIEWRRRMGHTVSVAHVNPNASVATIKAIIQNAYDSDSPPEFVCLVGDASAGGEINVAAATQTGDYEYSRLDGNDPLPDVALGRLSAMNINQLRWIVTKIVSYETDPNMDNTDWYKQAMVVAGHVGNGIGEVHLAHWVRMQLEAYGFDEIRNWYWNVDGEASGNQDFLTDAFRWGMSILHYRAFSHMNQLPLAVITNLPNDDGRWPAVLAISCNTGNFVADNNGNYQNTGMSEEFLRSRGGGIGAIGTATGETNVRFNNLVAAGVWKGVYEMKMYCLGWGLNQGKYEIWRTYHGFDDVYSRFMDWNNLMGDPGTSIWTEVPQRIEVTYSAETPVTSNLVVIDVTDDEDGDPVGDAQVCIYKEDEYQIVGTTDENGRAYLTMPDDVEPGVAALTVVKHNVFPFQGEIEFTEPARRLQAQNFTIDDDQQGQSNGNGNQELNPGERVEIAFHLANHGGDAIQGEVNLSITSLTHFVEVIDQEFVIDEVPAPGEYIEQRIVVQIDESAPYSELARLQFEITSGQQVWASVSEMEISAPNIVIESMELADNMLLPSQIKTLGIVATNTGSYQLTPSTALLVSLNDAVTVIDAESTFPRIPSNSSRALNGNLFRLRAHPLSIPGTICKMILIVETNDGFRDSTFFELILGEPEANDPFGPDEYGYVCYDSGDEGWDMAPEYDWIEINPAIQQRRFNGTVLNLTDTGDNQDASIAVNMPWDFQYYGQNYRQLTICSNGWAAFGDQHFIGNFRKQHVGQALAPKAMLAVWWDNLITIPNTSKIVTYNDREGGRFIVEWSQMRRLVEAGQGADETFQMILYDPERYQTVTGDGIITYQYNNVTNQNLVAHNDLPYCAIGISTPDGMSGMEYTYWNTYHAGATRVANGLAITFTTQSTTRTGVIEGFITDVETGEPIPRAQVLTTRSFWAESDENGFYRIDDIIIGDDYALTATALGWNDSTLTGFDVTEDETLTVDFSLLHPVIRFSHDRIRRDISVGTTTEVELTISNDGNGPLVWESKPKVIQEDERPIWEPISSLNIARIAEDDRVEGVVFADNHFFVSGANAGDPNTVYKISREGELVSSFEQVGNSQYGYKDLAWDGDLIWGSGEDTIFGIKPDGEVVARFVGPQSPQSALTFDTDRGWLWTSTVTTAIVAVNRQGQRVGRSIPNRMLRIYGLSYNSADPDGKTLYLHVRERDTERQLIYRVNPLAGEPELFHVLDPVGPGLPTCAEISGLYDPLNWVYITMENTLPADGGDRLDIYQIAPRRDWMKSTPLLGTINPGEHQEIVIRLGATDLPVMDLEGDLNFHHNAAFGFTSLPVNINIIPGPGALAERTLTFSRGWNLVSLNIVPELLDVVELMLPLVEDGIMAMMKDGQGRFYNPGAEFNNIPGYDTSSAYQIYVNSDATMSVRGTIIAPDAPIHLREGWNMVAYYPTESVAADIGFIGLGDALTIAKNISGRFYLPAYNFNNLGNLSEGNGYLIKVSQGIDLVYQIPEGGDRIAIADNYPTHFSIPNFSMLNHSLLLIGETSMAGFEVAVLGEEGGVVGVGVINKSGNAGIAIYGDDPATLELEGLKAGESFAVRIWNGENESDLPAQIIEGKLTWLSDGLTVAKVSPSQVPVEFGLDGAFPNPFNSSTNISFGLPKESIVDLAVYDLVGRQIVRLAAGQIKAGRHAVVWHGDPTPSGIYIIRLETGGKVLNRKVALIR